MAGLFWGILAVVLFSFAAGVAACGVAANVKPKHLSASYRVTPASGGFVQKQLPDGSVWTGPVPPDTLERARDDYATGRIELDEYEARVGRILHREDHQTVRT